MTTRSLAPSMLLCGWLVACGGSSSETPLPLPPHPLHEAYRSKRISARTVAPERAPEPEAEEEPQPEPDRGPPARSTWGGDAPRGRAAEPKLK